MTSLRYYSQAVGVMASLLAAAGAEVWRCGDVNDQVSPHRLLDRCSAQGLKSLFLEGGGKLAATFLKAGLVDTIAWFRAPILIGGDGVPAVAPLGLTEINHAARWTCSAIERIGEDSLETYARA